jgi:hypothetical protein
MREFPLRSRFWTSKLKKAGDVKETTLEKVFNLRRVTRQWPERPGRQLHHDFSPFYQASTK